METPQTVELRAKSDRLPWAVAVVALCILVIVVALAWYRDASRARERFREAGNMRAIAAAHLAAADSLASARVRLDSIYAVQVSEFRAALASLDSLNKAAGTRQDEIRHAPVDSLPVMARRIIADARQRGLLH